MLVRDKWVQLFDRYDHAIAAFMERYGYRLLRISMGIVFIWFGALKPFGLSPAEALVAKATTWIPIPGFLYILAAWEIVIGVCFLFERLTRVAVGLLFLHMPGTLLPLITLRGETWVQFPFALSLEGQYIVKNLVLIAAGMVLGGRVQPLAAPRVPLAARGLVASGAPISSSP